MGHGNPKYSSIHALLTKEEPLIFSLLLMQKAMRYDIKEKCNERVTTLSKWINEGYLLFIQMIVNGMAFCTFDHRIPLASVNSVQTQGDVFINKFGYIDVSHFHMMIHKK